MLHLTLNEVEIAILKSVARKGDANEEYRKLIATLSNLLDLRTGHIWLGPEHIARIQKFAFQSRNLTWQAALVSILGRTLGPDLGGFKHDPGHLTRESAP